MKEPIIGARFYEVRKTWGSRPPDCDEIVVIKVGRRWAEYRRVGVEHLTHLGGRFDKETRAIDGGQFSSPGRVFDDKASYEQHLRSSQLWKEFQEAVRASYDPPDEIAILKAADALGVKLESE